MENSINFSVTPLQLLLTVAFQIWIVVFPIVIIRKLNYLTALIESKSETQQATGLIPKGLVFLCSNSRGILKIQYQFCIKMTP